MNKVNAIILAGGKGTRLQTVMANVPKPLAPINGEPFLAFLMHQLAKSQMVDRVILSVGYMAETIEDWMRDTRNRWPFEIDVVREHDPMGTGGAIRLAMECAHSKDVLVMNGDSYLELSLGDFFSKHCLYGGVVTIASRVVCDASRYGELDLQVETGRVANFKEKNTVQKEGYINGGVYFIRTEAFKRFALGQPLSLETDILPRLLDEGVYGHLVSGKFIDIGTPESYHQAQTYLAQTNVLKVKEQ